jgi:hypothetical protein
MRDDSTIPRDVLEAPFPEELVKTRPGAFGGELQYLPGHAVIARLNEAFEDWSFSIVSHQVLDDEVLVLGQLRVDRLGIEKMAFGSSRVTRDKETGQTVSLGQDLKAGSTDALKKAASMCGVGLYLYSGERSECVAGSSSDRERFQRKQTQSERDDTPRQAETSRGNGNGRITSKQHRAIFAIARERGLSSADVRALSKEMFHRTVDYLSKSDASRLIEHLLGQ